MLLERRVSPLLLILTTVWPSSTPSSGSGAMLSGIVNQVNNRGGIGEVLAGSGNQCVVTKGIQRDSCMPLLLPMLMMVL